MREPRGREVNRLEGNEGATCNPSSIVQFESLGRPVFLYCIEYVDQGSIDKGNWDSIIEGPRYFYSQGVLAEKKGK